MTTIRDYEPRPLPAIKLNRRFLLTLLFIVIALVAAGSWGGYKAAMAKMQAKQPSTAELIVRWQSRLREQKAQLAQVEGDVQHQIDAMTLRLGAMQGRLLRLDALGQRFVESGFTGSEEFDFTLPAAMGGPHTLAPLESYDMPALSTMIERLEQRLDSRDQQLRLLDKLTSRQKLDADRFVQGHPVTLGWISSRYGYRTDPFTGKRTWHGGVDLAGKDGSDIIAVAGGVVTWAGERAGYGNLVEVDHGAGLITRYAHAKAIKVKVGDVVQKTQVVALMGTTGRSTGPHVHFEVLKNGRPTDPLKYMARAVR